MMWIILAIGILLVTFLIYRKIACYNEYNSTIKKVKPLPNIDIKTVESIAIPIKEENITKNTPSANRQEQNIKDNPNKTDDIVWTAELIRIRSIMFLEPKQTKRSPQTESNTQKRLCEKHKSLTPIELYELAVWFAELIQEADNLHKAKMFAEERKYCINAIKWCAKESLSVIYWQNRLNQVNELLGINPIEIANTANIKKEPSPKFLSASDKYKWFKSFTEPLETEYNFHHTNKNIKAEQIVVKKAIKWAKENNLIYYAQKWEKRIVKVTHDTKSSLEQQLKEKKLQRHPHDITPIKKKRRPRIPYTPSIKKEEGSK